jgi:hypothetical protein
MEIGSAFDDIVDHPIMGRNGTLHRHFSTVAYVNEGVKLLLRRRSREK